MNQSRMKAFHQRRWFSIATGAWLGPAIVVGCAVCIASTYAADPGSGIPAFPGAEGFGRFATGGRGGDVYFVTNLDDSGPGSLRDGIREATGARTILFNISGTIRLESELLVDRPNLTIAGETAPGEGICIRDHAMVLSADNLIVRHIHSRLGTASDVPEDALSISEGKHIIVDHCSASWSVDETVSVSGRSHLVTVQWCYITESLHDSTHNKGPHGYGSLIRTRVPAEYTFHHNLYAHHASRNPRPGSYPGGRLTLDFCNNVIYDWGFKAGYSGGETDFVDLNYRGNYLVAGPSTTWIKSAFQGGHTDTRIFQSGNLIDVNRNGVLDGTDRGWEALDGEWTRSDAPFAVPEVDRDEAGLAYRRVLSLAGAVPWARDAVDRRITSDVLTESGHIINDVEEVGGWPAIGTASPPQDTDADGMSDAWERALGHDSNVADQNGDTDGDGYTNLEAYLHWRGMPHASTPVNQPVDVDLLPFASGYSAPAFAVSSQHGSVSLLPDGHTAQWVPDKDFAGTADFEFSATESEGLMTCRVRVLVTPELMHE